MPFTVVYDANALYPNAQRDLLIRVAQQGLVQAKWTSEILEEMCRARLRRKPDLDAREPCSGSVSGCTAQSRTAWSPATSRSSCR
jgi:hypothetical protein